MTTTVLRSARPADHDAIVALPGLGASTRRLLAGDLAGTVPRHVQVAVDAAGRVVGFAMSNRQPDEVHLLDLAVAADVRRTGIATRLVAALATLGRADGASAMTLEVRVSNGAGRGLYHRLGFVDRGTRPGYYQDGEDARILWHDDLAALAARSHAGDPAPPPTSTHPTRTTPPTSTSTTTTTTKVDPVDNAPAAAGHRDAMTGRGR